MSTLLVLATAFAAILVLAVGSGWTVRHQRVSLGLLVAACVAFLPVLYLANEEGRNAYPSCGDLSCQDEGWLPILGALGIGAVIFFAGYGLGRLIAYRRRPVVGHRNPRGGYSHRR